MAKQKLVKKGSQYGILDEASNTVLPISENMKLVQKQGRYGILDGNSVIPIDDFSESISDSDLDILKKKNSTESVGQPVPKPGLSASPKIQGSGLVASPAKQSSGQIVTGPSASFSKSGSKLLGQEPTPKELPSTEGELLRAPEKPKPYNLKDKSWLENKQDINLLSKDVLNKSKLVVSNIKAFNNDSKLFQDDLNSFQQLAQTNPSDPQLATLQQDLQKRQEDLNRRSQALNNQASQIDVAQVELKKKALANYKKKAEQGNWGGALWNSIINGLESSGQGMQRAAIDSGIELLDFMGIPYASKEKQSELRNKVLAESKGKLTEEEVNAKVKDLSKKEVIGTFKPILEKGYEGVKSKGTTEEYIQEKKKEGFVPLAALGVAESLPAMLSGRGYGQFVVGAMQTYANLNEQMDNDPALAGMDENERKKITLPISIISGYLEETSWGKILREEAPALKPVVNKLVSTVLSKIPQNATLNVIEKTVKDFAESTAGKLLLKTGENAARAYGNEAETGALQSASEMLVKEIYDKANNVDLFKNPELLSKEFLEKIAYDANIEGIGGLIIGGPMMAVQSAFEGKDLSNDDFVAMKSLIQDPENARLTIAKITTDLSSGTITKEEADAQLKALNESKRLLDLIPDQIPVESQRKAFNILADNAKIETELEKMSKDIAGKDPNLVTDIVASMKEKEAQIEKNNQELSKLPQNAVQEQTTSEVPVQPESGVSGEMAKGEPQAEPKGPAEEVKAEEVVTPTEEVVAEEVVPVEVSKLSDTQQSAIQEGVKLGEDMVKRYPKQDDLVTKYKALQKFQKTNQEYINADQSQKDEMTRQINYALGLAPKTKTPSAEKVLGKKADMVLVNEMDAIKSQLRLEAKAAKQAFDIATKEGKQKLKESKDALNKTRKDVAVKLKSMVSRGLLTPSQQTSIYSGLQTNINNPVILERFLNKVDKIINRADYVKDLSDANKLRTRISKISTREGLGDPEKNIAKGFLKVDPKNVKDLTEYIKRAQEFINSVAAPKVVDGKTVKPSVINYQEANKYLNDLVIAQGKDLQEAALARYDYLVQEGKITGDMSLDEIEAYVASIEQDPEKFDYPKSAQVMKDSKEFFEDAKKEILDMIKNGEVSKEDLPLIKDFIDINVLRLGSAEAYRASKALENFIVNGSTENMGLILSNYTGSLNAAKMLKMLEYMKRTVDKKVKVGGYKKYIYGIGNILHYGSNKKIKKLSDIYQERWLMELSHLDNFGSTYFGVKPWEQMKEAMGFNQIEDGAVNTKHVVSDFNKKIEEKYKDRMNGKHAFLTSYTANELSMVGTLYRESIDKDAEKYFKERKKNIKETIEYLEETEGKEDVAERLRDIYDKLGIEKATNGKEVFDKANPVIQEALNDYIAEYQKWYPEFSRIAKEQFGIILSQDVNYLPDFWEATVDYDPEADIFSKGGFATKQDILQTEKAGNFIKPKYPDGLPRNSDGSVKKIINFDFFQNNNRALTSTIGNVKTAPGMNQYLGFVNSPDFRYIIKNRASRDMFKEKMNYTVRSLTNNVKTPKSGAIFDFLAPIYTYLGKAGSRLGLSSMFAAGTQSLPLMLNTIDQLDGDGMKLVDAMKLIDEPKVQSWMNNMPYSVSVRDKQAVTSIEFASKLLDKGDYATKQKTLGTIKKALDGYIEKGLVPADVYTARVSWLAIYLDELRKLGVKDFDFEGYDNPESIKAAREAERVIKREHNQSMAELLPRLYSGKDSARKVIRMSMGPFSGYSMSLKDKIKANTAILFDTNFKATQEEKAQAAKSLLATLDEQIFFNLLKWGIRSAVVYAANKIDDEDEDELSKLLRMIQEAQTAGVNVLQSFTGSLPFLEEEAEQYAMNLTLDFVDYLTAFITKKEGGKLSAEQESAWKKFESGGEEKIPETYEEEQKKKTQEKLDKPLRVFIPESEGMVDDLVKLVGGSSGVTYQVAKKSIIDNFVELYNGGYEDKYGKFHPYTDEEKQKIRNRMYLAPLEMSIAPSEFRSLQNRRKKNFIKKVLKRENYEKKMEAEFNKEQ